MSTIDRQAHWQGVYTTKGEAEVSWYQETPAPSLELLKLVGSSHDSAVIDIGGGASRLVDSLVSGGYQNVTVLDLSAAALASTKERIGSKGERVTWVACDVTTWKPSRLYDIWHDRAAFHFLTDPADQKAYAQRLHLALRPGGHVIIGTFAPDGPEKCSGLPVARHNAQTLGVVLGLGFTLVDSRSREHLTPWGSTQKFQFSTFKRVS